MSAQTFPTVPIDPNDPHLTQEVDEGYRRLRSRRIFELDANLATKAKEHDNCGRTAESYGCSRHETPEIIKEIERTCKQRFSLCCGPRITYQRLGKIDWLLEMIEHARDDAAMPQKIALITVRYPLERKREMVDLFQSAFFGLSEELRKPVAKTLHYVRPCIKGYEDETHIVGQVVYWGQDPIPERFKALYAKLEFGVEVSVQVRDLSHAEEIFREAFTILVPHDSIEQAELEVLFHRLDLTTTYQHDVFKRHADDLLIPSSKNEDLEGNTSTHDPFTCDGCEVVTLPVCPICHKEADLISGLHLPHARADEVHASGWRKMYRKPPG